MGWIYGEHYDPHVWDFTQATVKAHTQYGISPFYKISVDNRNSLPYGNIITISEGDVGLPHKMFYNLDINHEVCYCFSLHCLIDVWCFKNYFLLFS